MQLMAIYQRVNRAKRNGLIPPPTICEDCGKGGLLHGHHEDYSKPLDVNWLCPSCHGKRRIAPFVKDGYGKDRRGHHTSLRTKEYVCIFELSGPKLKEARIKLGLSIQEFIETTLVSATEKQIASIEKRHRNFVHFLWGYNMQQIHGITLNSIKADVPV
jgi:hypothetical protein